MLQSRYYSDDGYSYTVVSWWLILIIIIIVVKLCFIAFILVRCHRRRKRRDALRAQAIAGAHAYPGQGQPVPLGQILATAPGYVPPPMYTVGGAARGDEKSQYQPTGVVTERSLDSAEVEHAPPAPPMQPPAAVTANSPVQYRPVSELPTGQNAK